MKVFVQQKKTELYLGPDGEWVNEKSGAQDFGNSMKALDHWLGCGLQGVQMVLDFGNENFDLKFDMGRQ